jgi:hypothetical protein
MEMREGFVCALLCVGLFACAYNKEYAPIGVNPVRPRQPNQQRQVALATQTAVEKAAAEAKLDRFKGRTARIEVNGVFPHSQEDLLAYAGTILAGEASKAGIKLLPKEKLAAGVVVFTSQGAAAAEMDQPGDVRLVMSLDWAGIDLKDKSYTKGWPLAGWIGVPTLATIIGLVVAGTADKDFNLLLALPFIIPALIGDIIWMIFDTTTGHTFTMVSRVHATIRAIPQAQGLELATGVGEGESSIVIDPESDVGYSLVVDLPSNK